MAAPIVFGQATEADIDELIRMRIEYMIEDFGQVSETAMAGMRSQLPGYFREHLGRDCIAFVARDGDHLLSVALLIVSIIPASALYEHGRKGEVLSVYTEPEYRGRGLCTTNMKNLVDYARQIQLDSVNLSATDEGYPVYNKVGFADHQSRYKAMQYKLR